MKTILFLTILFAGFHSLMAQQNTITITGKVVENGSKLPLEYATVKLLDAGTNQLINGTVTSTEGVFALEPALNTLSLKSVLLVLWRPGLRILT